MFRDGEYVSDPFIYLCVFVCVRACVCVLVVDRYIGQADQGIFQIKASADMFFCLADVYEAGLLFWRGWKR